jgi:hypothetical protein
MARRHAWLGRVAAAALAAMAAPGRGEVSDTERGMVRTRIVARLNGAGIRYRDLEVDREGRCDLDLTRSGVESLDALRGLPIRSLV